MSRLRFLSGAATLLAAPIASAGILFMPHLSEYAKPARAPYDEGVLFFEEIQDVYDRDGHEVNVGAPFVPDGESVRVALLTYRPLWIGNAFRDSGIPLLADHDQFCRVVLTAGWQQATGAAVSRGRVFGMHSGGSGPGDVFGICGIYGHDHIAGPLKFNGMLAGGVKAPVGRYDRDSLLNTGTRYWSAMPQLAGHAELYGRLIVDGILAWQFNGDDDHPAYGGLVPSSPADVWNAEANVAWKFTEHWFANAGFTMMGSHGSNRFDRVDIESREAVPAQDLCDALHLGVALCDSTSLFYAKAASGHYRDDGTRLRALTVGFTYIYRSSSVLSVRALLPLSGRGSQIDVPLDLYPAVPDLLHPGRFQPGPAPVLRTPSTLNGVQEAASVSASPGFELRLVHLFWAP